MSSAGWRPVVKTGREDVLTSDFPLWLREGLTDWLRNRLGFESDWARVQLLLDFQVAFGQDCGFRAGLTPWSDVVRWWRSTDDETFTNFLDYLLWALTSYPRERRWENVKTVLSNGGSKWTVMKLDDHWRLTEQVPDGVLESANEALSGRDSASQKLQEAWGDAFGTNPRASVAYYNAVVAVENAAFAVIPSPIAEPTLATLFSILEADSPKWRLILRDSDKAPSAKSLAAMLRLLWRGHDSRHGAEEYEDCSLQEARAGVLLAATLVYWFTSGAVQATSD